MGNKVKLNLVNVENRESRLGSVISWEGKASELNAQSAYRRENIIASGEGSPCGGNRNGAGCRGCALVDQNMPFNQQTMCVHAIVACQAGEITDMVMVEHSPIGCSAHHATLNLGYKLGLAKRNKPHDTIHIVSTNLTEKDMVYGASNQLRQSLRDAYERYKPKGLFISMACSTAIIGEDIDSIATEIEEELGIPVVPLHCEGFRSKHWSTGFDITQHGIVRQVVNPNPVKQPDLINIVVLWGTDYFTPLLKPLGLRVNYIMDVASYDELRQCSEAVATATFCHTLGSYFATALETKFGIPQIKAPQPFGIAATDAWLRAVGEIVGKQEEVENYIKEQHEKWLPEIEELRKQFKGIKGFVATGSSYAHAMIAVIRDLGITVDGSVVYHHDPTYDAGYPEQDTLKHLVETSGDIDHFTVSKTQQFQFKQVYNKVKPDFVIIRHPGLSTISTKLGIPTFPMGDEHFPLAYEGIVRVGRALIEILARRKFGQVLKRHVKLPYTDWWLNQTDAFVLAKHPEILEDDYVDITPKKTKIDDATLKKIKIDDITPKKTKIKENAAVNA